MSFFGLFKKKILYNFMRKSQCVNLINLDNENPKNLVPISPILNPKNYLYDYLNKPQLYLYPLYNISKLYLLMHY